MTHDTDWILGTHGNQKNEDDRSKIVIGYHEIIKLNLAAINESYAVYQKFEVNLSSPGRGLVSIHSAESEGMMNRFLQQRAATGTGCMPQGTEKAELSIITEQRVIRRICLNNRAISMEIDLCSLVSVVTDDRLENNRILEVVRRTEIKSLGHEH